MERPLCEKCKKNLARKYYGRQNRTQGYRKDCGPCHRKRYGMSLKQYQKPYRRNIKPRCEFCGFIPIHPCQLDIDHIDGNHHNNNVDNLQTLCANCHRLKTHLNKDYEVR